MKNITYSDDIYNVSFGLYNNLDCGDFETTKSNILTVFKKDKVKEIQTRLKQAGLFLVEFNYHSPKGYNYKNDSIDTVIRIIDKDKLRQFILTNETEINKLMKQNKSYDGYISLTKNNVTEELNALQEQDYEPDVTVLMSLLKDCITREDCINIITENLE